MAKKKKADFGALSADELHTREVVLRETLARLGMQRHSRRLDRTSDLNATKKDLARVLTALAAKRHATQEGAS